MVPNTPFWFLAHLHHWVSQPHTAPFSANVLSSRCLVSRLRMVETNLPGDHQYSSSNLSSDWTLGQILRNPENSTDAFCRIAWRTHKTHQLRVSESHLFCGGKHFPIFNLGKVLELWEISLWPVQFAFIKLKWIRTIPVSPSRSRVSGFTSRRRTKWDISPYHKETPLVHGPHLLQTWRNKKSLELCSRPTDQEFTQKFPKITRQTRELLLLTHVSRFSIHFNHECSILTSKWCRDSWASQPSFWAEASSFCF